jgi:Na+-transporting methylmalonyl-CoA/oxaloacetate decarboxylase gamma subunit
MNIRYLKIIGNISFIVGILSFLLSFVGNITLGEVIFLELAFASILAQRIRNNKILYITAFIVMIIPIVFFNNLADRILISIAYFYTLYLNLKGLTKITYGGSIEGFKSAVRIMILVVLISIFLSLVSPLKLAVFNRLVFPYFMVYLVASVILLRTLRHLEYNPASKEIDKINLRYSVGIISASFMLSLEVVRTLLFKSIYYIFRLLVDAISILFAGILWIFGYIFEFLFSFLKGINMFKPKMSGLEKKELPPENLGIDNKLGLMKQLEKKSNFSSLLQNKILVIVLGITILVIVLYIIIKVLQRYSFSRKEKKEDYTEVKEFIPRERNSINLLEKLFSLVRPKSSVEKIRLYYRKYLHACIERGLEIRHSDTTLDIYKKSENFFNKDIIKRMRDIYIGVRYSDLISNSAIVSEFVGLYRKMNLKNRKERL